VGWTPGVPLGLTDGFTVGVGVFEGCGDAGVVGTGDGVAFRAKTAVMSLVALSNIECTQTGFVD